MNASPGSGCYVTHSESAAENHCVVPDDEVVSSAQAPTAFTNSDPGGDRRPIGCMRRRGCRSNRARPFAPLLSSWALAIKLIDEAGSVDFLNQAVVHKAIE